MTETLLGKRYKGYGKTIKSRRMTAKDWLEGARITETSFSTRNGFGIAEKGQGIRPARKNCQGWGRVSREEN